MVLGNPKFGFTYYVLYTYMWGFPKMVIPQNGWFIMDNPIKMDDLGGTPIFGNTHIFLQIDCLDVFIIILNPTLSSQRCWNLVVVLAWYPLQPSWVREPRMFRNFNDVETCCWRRLLRCSSCFFEVWERIENNMKKMFVSLLFSSKKRLTWTRWTHPKVIKPFKKSRLEVALLKCLPRIKQDCDLGHELRQGHPRWMEKRSTFVFRTI